MHIPFEIISISHENKCTYILYPGDSGFPSISKTKHKCLLSKKNEEVCSSGSEKFQYLFVFAAKSEEKITVSTQDMLPNKQR